MSKDSPEVLHEQFEKAFAERDMEALLALYTDDAVLVGPNNTEVTGKAAIAEGLQGFLDAAGDDGTLKMKTRYVHACGDVAMLSNSWVLNGTNADGSPLQMSGQTVEVARRQADGRWLMILDHPEGAQ